MELMGIKKSTYEKALEQAYYSSITVNQIIDYIESKRTEVINQRNEAEEGLEEIIRNFGSVTCGLRNDRVEDIVKALVRDKTIKSITELHDRIDNEFIPRIRNYILWSFYNQTTNDLIEHFFIKHEKIIPTLRKIHDIDFFVKIGDHIVPFDLKITHISEEFFDLYHQGIIENHEEAPDSFSVDESGITEIEKIKAFYKDKKKEFQLPNYGNLTKKEMIEELESVPHPEFKSFVESLYHWRKQALEALPLELKKLEWWNYKYQGPRLFSNNNRLFLFLAYTNVFEDGRPIKGKLDLIEQAVNELLDTITADKINIIKYHYDKDRSLKGNYAAKSVSVLITAEK